MGMYSKAASEVQINGFRSSLIPIHSSNREGCPLSMQSFALCINPLIDTGKRSQGHSDRTGTCKNDCNGIRRYRHILEFTGGCPKAARNPPHVRSCNRRERQYAENQSIGAQCMDNDNKDNGHYIP